MSTETVRWGIAAACTVLILKTDPGARKQYFVAILALESPGDVATGIKSENGLWVACLCLAMKIFYSFPFQLDFPLTVYVFIATLPAAALAIRGTLGGTTASTVIACICAYTYFANMDGPFLNAFRRDRLINSICILFTTIACVWFFAMQAMGGGGKSA
ncbi:hypothetical protein KC19_9G126200 [Ceratodon purpureus]|uniref:Uncharacterized protein n=1 Tax=Ceratodon purpureus TaxID=3225 RepID=A0A8T0GVN9_CERPU|nr:hypothetical protein KC19_9G126200 [Ceratodon purpureus]